MSLIPVRSVSISYEPYVRPSLAKHDDGICAICTENLSLDEIVHRLGCGHLFHSECTPNTSIFDHCPRCRIPIEGRALIPREFLRESIQRYTLLFKKLYSADDGTALRAHLDSYLDDLEASNPSRDSLTISKNTLRHLSNRTEMFMEADEEGFSLLIGRIIKETMRTLSNIPGLTIFDDPQAALLSKAINIASVTMHGFSSLLDDRYKARDAEFQARLREEILENRGFIELVNDTREGIARLSLRESFREELDEAILVINKLSPEMGESVRESINNQLTLMELQNSSRQDCINLRRWIRRNTQTLEMLMESDDEGFRELIASKRVDQSIYFAADLLTSNPHKIQLIGGQIAFLSSQMIHATLTSKTVIDRYKTRAFEFMASFSDRSSKNRYFQEACDFYHIQQARHTVLSWCFKIGSIGTVTSTTYLAWSILLCNLSKIGTIPEVIYVNEFILDPMFDSTAIPMLLTSFVILSFYYYYNSIYKVRL